MCPYQNMMRFVIASQRVRLRRPDDRLREAIQNHKRRLDCFVASLLAMTYSAEVADDRYSETGRSEISQSLPLNCAMNSVFIGV